MSARSREQRDRDRADLLAVLVEAGEPLWTSAIIDRAVTYDVQHGSAEYRQITSDLRGLVRAGALVCLQRAQFAPAEQYALAGSVEADQAEDAAEVRRLMAGWEDAS